MVQWGKKGIAQMRLCSTDLLPYFLVSTPPATYGPGGNIFGKKKELLEAPFSLGVFYTAKYARGGRLGGVEGTSPPGLCGNTCTLGGVLGVTG